MASHWLIFACMLSVSQAQSNYGSQANNIEYQGEGLPEQTVLDGKVTKLDDLSPVIFLNRTKAALNCASGSMQLELKFNENFYGIAYADFDRNSACQVVGKGANSYKLELPLKGCGTRQDPLRVFTNNVVVRFHPGLEMDGDEVITIVCRYPPPVVPKPVFNPLILPPEKIIPPLKSPLAGTHILLIICAILFLTLMLLGLGVSYLCLRRRALPVPRKLIEESGSIASRESIQEVKIPRAHAAYPLVAESASVASETIPSDYPSETPSEAEHVHTNAAFIMEESYHSEGYNDSQETYTSNGRQYSGAMTSAPPAFDVRVRVQRPPAPPSPQSTLTGTETDGASFMQSTYAEQHERQESVRTVSPVALPPARPPRVPLYSQVSRQHHKQQWLPRRPRSIVSVNTEMTDTHSVTEVTDRSHARMFHIKKPPPPPPTTYMSEQMQREEQEMMVESLEPIPETPIMPARKPEITSHVVDDVFLRTITEKRTIEDIERHKRFVTEYKQVPPPPPKFDVTIRNHSVPEPQWENFSDISSASGMTVTPKMERAPMSLPQKYIGKGGPDLFSPDLVALTKHQRSLLPELPPAQNPLFREEDEEEISPPVNPQPPLPQNWSNLTRVLSMEAQDEVLHESERAYRLTREERLRWREVLTHESTLRRELAKSTTREDFLKVSQDRRFSNLYPVHKWEVIIRILAPPPDKPKNRYRKKTEWDSRSRRSSLPTLYEYDSDVTSLKDPTRSRRSSYRSDHVDMRSMSEMMVDYAREHVDAHSEVSDGDHFNGQSWGRHSLHRSASQPSLARSATEVVERWTVPEYDEDLTPTPHRRGGAQGQSTFSSSSEFRTFQSSSSRAWRD